MDSQKQKEFENFWKDIQKVIHGHPVITSNPYCKWFKKGEISKEQLIDLFEQFAVFSKWFLLVQMMRMLNAPDLDAEKHARYILVNELGVGIDQKGLEENQPFKTEWAHINWLRITAEPLQLNPQDLGSWDSASADTRKFIKGLEETYGSKDGQIGRGASYAIETWAAWGIGRGKEEEFNNFWKELIIGIEQYNRKNGLEGDRAIPLDFFQFHFEAEKGHGDNVLEELKESFERPGFDSDEFFHGGTMALEAIHTFWLGLDKSRQAIEKRTQERN